MFGSQLVKHVEGGYRKIGNYKSTNLPITEADADSATGVLKRGKLVDAIFGTSELAFTTAMMVGLLENNINLNGTTDAAGFQKFVTNQLDIPMKRGQAVPVIIPDVDGIWEFEGGGQASYDTLVITSVTTGFLASTDARNTLLTCEKGGWRKAQSTELAFALLEKADVTPVVGGAGVIRIAVRFISPVVKA